MAIAPLAIYRLASDIRTVFKGDFESILKPQLWRKSLVTTRGSTRLMIYFVRNKECTRDLIAIPLVSIQIYVNELISNHNNLIFHSANCRADWIFLFFAS